MAGKKSEKKQRPRQRTGDRFRGLRRELRQLNMPHLRVLDRPPDNLKMSEVLNDFVDPYAEYATTEFSMRRLLTLGMAAWNCALMPDAEQEGFILELVDISTRETDEETRSVMKQVLRALVDRKENDFAEHQREIAAFDLKGKWPNMFLSVASILEPKAALPAHPGQQATDDTEKD